MAARTTASGRTVATGRCMNLGTVSGSTAKATVPTAHRPTKNVTLTKTVTRTTSAAVMPQPV